MTISGTMMERRQPGDGFLPEGFVCQAGFTSATDASKNVAGCWGCVSRVDCPILAPRTEVYQSHPEYFHRQTGSSGVVGILR